MHFNFEQYKLTTPPTYELKLLPTDSLTAKTNETDTDLMKQ
jgi:hypothetical protein